MARTCLVLGSTGMLGQALISALTYRGENAVGLARKDADICLDVTDVDTLAGVVDDLNPDIVINAAAQVDLTYCEQNPAQCYLINTKVSGLLANSSARYVYISTDHYYTGDQDRKHDEEEPVNLCNEYARTKYLGERLTLLNDDALVLRTNIVGFRGWPERPSFIEWVLTVLEKGEPFNMFTDYYTSSIDVHSFSESVFDLIDKNARGVINLASSEVANKKQFIETVAQQFELSDEPGRSCTIMQTLSGVKRNESLGLDVSKAENILGYRLPDLQKVVNNLAENHKK